MKLLKKEKDLIEFIFISFMIICFYGYNTNIFGINIISIEICLFFMLINIIRFNKKEWFNLFIDTIIKFRYLIYGVIFVLCVLLKLHGSSIGVYTEFFPQKNYENKTIYYGRTRGIRSDEFLVLTPYYLSQTYNNFSKTNNYMSIDGQNMIIGYNAPVLDITTLCKPLNWGYILLGRDYGLSWYWCMKQILLFAFAFEMMYIITQKNKVLSIIGAVMVAYGPSTQWWFAPHMPDVILWSMALFTVAYHFFASDKKWLKNLLTIIIPLITTEYVIALFPSFQIGLGIFIFILFIMAAIRDKIKLFKDKEQIIRIIIVIALTLGLVVYFVLTNKDALLASMNTSYPGGRISTGGDKHIKDLLTDLTTIFLSYKPELTYSNLSEASTYIHFGLFFVLISPLLIKNQKKNKDKNYLVGIAFVSVLLLYGFFMLVGFPEIIAKLTLFSYINRMKMIFGLISVFFTIWSIDAILKSKDKINAKYYIICTIIYCITYYLTLTTEQLTYLSRYTYIAEILLFGFILLCLYFDYKKLALSIMLGLTVFASISINPVARTATDIYNHPSATFISETIKKDKDSYWLGYDSLLYPNYLLANGAKAINAVNFYPDWSKWKIIDPKGKNKEIYNRYAHIYVTFSEDDKDHISMANLDQVKLETTIDTLVDLKVKYILSKEELDQASTKYKLKEIYKDSDCKIYEIVEKE